MTFDQTISMLQQIAVKKGIDYTLEKLTPVLMSLGNPHCYSSISIHVAGTNGKGSTIAFVEQMLVDAGYRVGTFTSPHLMCYTERLKVNQTPISTVDFTTFFNQVSPFVSAGLTEFEILTIMSFLYFRASKTDVNLYEVGLGGRLDATNVITPSCSIITTIDYDHQQFLGDTLEDIAAEKCGIIKPLVPVITIEAQSKAVLNVISSVAQKNQAELYVESAISDDVVLGLPGGHQFYNAALAVKAIRLLFPQLDYGALKDSLKAVSHWGRCTHINRNGQDIIIDAAHNIGGVYALNRYVETLYKSENMKSKLPVVVFGLNKSKDWQAMVHILMSKYDTLIYCEFDQVFSVSHIEVEQYLGKPLPSYVLNESLPKHDFLVVTGSIYFIGNFLSLL